MKICIVRSDRMGDLILTLPVIKSIKEENKYSVVHVIGSEKNINISKHFSFIDKFINKSNSLSKFINLVRFIRSERYDYFLNFSPGWFGILLGFLSKSKISSSLILKSRYKSKILSKFWKIIITKLFFTKIKIVNRYELIQMNKSIHQTNMMMSLTKETGLLIKYDTKLIFNFSNTFDLQNNKPLCVIHLSSKWINNYYSETNFLKLLNSLKEKNILIYLTSDQTTYSKFTKIFKKFHITNNLNQLTLTKQQIVICENFDFENWVSLINQADYVITPECGCTHIASLTKCKLGVIYDSDNSSSSIMNEYAPWKKEYLSFETNDKNLNKKILNFIY